MAAITPERVAAMQRLLEVVPADIQNTGGVVWTVYGHQVAEEEYEFEQVKLADCNDDLAEFAVAARTFVPDLLEAYAAATQWRPIETAPENASVLVYIPNAEHYGEGIYRAILVNMGTGKRWMTTGRSVGRDLCDETPTHWLPLPAPPVQEER